VIRFGAIVSVVAVAICLLVGGAVSGTLALVYVSIGLAALALLMLVVGVVVWRDEVFGSARAQPAGTADSGVVPVLAGHVPDGRKSLVREQAPVAEARSAPERAERGQATGREPAPAREQAHGRDHVSAREPMAARRSVARIDEPALGADSPSESAARDRPRRARKPAEEPLGEPVSAATAVRASDSGNAPPGDLPVSASGRASSGGAAAAHAPPAAKPVGAGQAAKATGSARSAGEVGTGSGLSPAEPRSDRSAAPPSRADRPAAGGPPGARGPRPSEQASASASLAPARGPTPAVQAPDVHAPDVHAPDVARPPAPATEVPPAVGPPAQSARDSHGARDGESAPESQGPDGQRPAGQRSGDGQSAGNTQVSIVPGIARYHTAECILIRFLGDDDLEVMSRTAAEAAGCVPCKACRPEKVGAGS
jgi:hypothetical protein